MDHFSKDKDNAPTALDVTAEEHTAFLAAESKGTYLNLHFKPQQHRYHRVWPQEK